MDNVEFTSDSSTVYILSITLHSITMHGLQEREKWIWTISSDGQQKERLVGISIENKFLHGGPTDVQPVVLGHC